jgi:hypothetical protein
MKIKGIVSAGKDRGNAIEFSPQEKAPIAVKDAVAAASAPGEVWWSEQVDVQDLQYSSTGQDNRGFANNRYIARGNVMIRKTVTKQTERDGKIVTTEDLIPAVRQAFYIEFDDVTDNLGQPDLKTTVFKLE